MQILTSIVYFSIFQLRTDTKYNYIVTEILGQYINFRARKTSTNKNLGNDAIRAQCSEIWQQVHSIVCLNFVQVLMVLLRTDAQNLPLAVLLYPLFDKTHDIIRRKPQQSDMFPECVVIAATVLFYKHWMQMFTAKSDIEEHKKKAWASLKENFTKIPFPLPDKLESFIRRLDDRIYHTYLYKGDVW